MREPYTPVGFLAQRLSVQRLLALRHPDVSDMKPHERLDTADEAAQQWSAMDICEGMRVFLIVIRMCLALRIYADLP